MTMGDYTVVMETRVRNFAHVQGKLSGFPKQTENEIMDALLKYYDKDFKPMLGRIILGFRGRNVPARNAPRWAAIKASTYGIGHSLGRITGKMHRGAMGVRPEISKSGNRINLHANFNDIPKDDYPYLVVVHEGLDKLHQPYPVVEAARSMTHTRLLKRLDDSVSNAWKKSGG